jgi:hypothetical protein
MWYRSSSQQQICGMRVSGLMLSMSTSMVTMSARTGTMRAIRILSVAMLGRSRRCFVSYSFKLLIYSDTESISIRSISRPENCLEIGQIYGTAQEAS